MKRRVASLFRAIADRLDPPTPSSIAFWTWDRLPTSATISSANVVWKVTE